MDWIETTFPLKPFVSVLISDRTEFLSKSPPRPLLCIASFSPNQFNYQSLICGCAGNYKLHGDVPRALKFVRDYFQASIFGDSIIQRPELSIDWEVLFSLRIDPLRD
ncbi:hypothetical protein HAX54_035990 [Datura stramonium]|uniref:Uncharacterized protein n=1 Tax=Datura stramonium TaxID=4076 RepID=A0ABS8VJY4_DATST|nr:hypothetical protein [Datura stramonium]